jgi:hypothetical protein
MSLSFVSPWFLLGLLSLAIPIYLHLYHRKTPIRKEFPSLRLIKLSVEFVARRRKIRNLILLALRILTIILIIMALSRPFIGKTASARLSSANPAAFVVLLDNSMSMGSTHKGISLYNTAKAKALEILDQMQPEDKATVGLLNDPGRLLYGQLTWDRDSLKRSLSNARLSMSGTSVYSSLLPSLKLLVGLKTYRRAIYIVTDMTEIAWKQLIDKYNLSEIDPGIDLILVPVGGPAPENMAITSIKSGSLVVMAERKTEIQVKVANYSGRDRKTRIVLTINSERKNDREVEIPANSEKVINFVAEFSKLGMNHINASISADSLEYDNIRHMALRVFEPCKILLINQEKQGAQTKSNEDIFLRFALNPLNRTSSANFIPEIRTAEEAGNLNLNDYSVISLINLRHISPKLLQNLSDYLLSGGNLITFLGNRVEPEWYNTHLIDNLGGGYLLPARIFRRVGNAISKTVAYQMTDLDTGHPAFSIFTRDGNGDPGRAHIFEFFQTRPNNTALVLSRMSHGLPGIIEEKRGQGRSLLITFNADTSWSNWPLKPTWLPFLHQTLIAMVTANELNLGSPKPGMPVSATISRDEKSKLTLFTPSRREVKIETTQTGKGLFHFSSRDTNETGYYELRADNRIVSGFAVNPPARESNLKRIAINKIPRFITLKSENKKGQTVKEKVSLLRDGYDLSRPALWLLLLIMIVECWFANIKTKIRTKSQ